MLSSELKAYEFTIQRLVRNMLKNNRGRILGTYKDDDGSEYTVKLIIEKK